MLINELIVDLSKDPFNPSLNFDIAMEYEHIGQTASAISFYLRTAEYGPNNLLTYRALLKASLCFRAQQNRENTVKDLILKAIAVQPERPEGYFLLSQFHESQKNWQESYTWAEVGSCFQLVETPPLPDLIYDGLYCLLFQKAVAGWWVGRKDESKNLFQHLLDNYEMKPEYLNSCLNNMKLFS